MHGSSQIEETILILGLLGCVLPVFRASPLINQQAGLPIEVG